MNLFEEEKVGWGRRIIRAIILFVLNFALLIVVPSFLLSYVSSLVPLGSIPFSETTIYAFGGTITALQVLGALTEGMLVSVPFESGGFIATALYIYVAVDGGTVALTERGVSFVLAFKPLLFLLVLPPLFGALRVPISFLLDQHEAARAAPDTV